MRSRKPDKIPISLIESLIEAAKKIGISKTETLLYNASLCKNPEQLLKVVILRNAVCNEFQITEKMLNELKSSQISTQASDVYAYLLNKYLDYGDKDIKHVFVKRYCNFHNIIKRIKHLDSNIKPDRDLLNKITSIEKSVEKHFQTNQE